MRDGVSNHRRIDSLSSHLFKRRRKKQSNPTSLVFVMVIHRSPVNFPLKGQYVSIWWRHHGRRRRIPFTLRRRSILLTKFCVTTSWRATTICWWPTVYPKKYAHGFCFAVLCCGYTLTDLPISIRLTSLALWQSDDCPSASKATLMNMDKYFIWIHYERLHNHNKAKHNKTVCIFLGIYCNSVR